MKLLLKILFPISMLAVLGLGITAVTRVYRAPLAEPLGLQQPAVVEAAAPAPIVPEALPAVQAATAVPEGVCGRSGMVDVLVVGVDDSIGADPRGANLIRYMQVNFDNQTVTMMAFSQFLTAKHNGSDMILATLYKDASDQAAGDAKAKATAGTRAVARYLSDTYNLTADKYITVRLDEFVNMVDELGGVKLKNPTAFDTERKVHFDAGDLTLDGAKAAEYVRTVSEGGESARNQRQNRFIEAAFDQYLTPEGLVKVPALFDNFANAIVTDLSTQDIEQLGCLAGKVPDSAIKMYRMDKDQKVFDPSGKEMPQQQVVTAVLKDLFK